MAIKSLIINRIVNSKLKSLVLNKTASDGEAPVPEHLGE